MRKSRFSDQQIALALQQVEHVRQSPTLDALGNYCICSSSFQESSFTAGRDGAGANDMYRSRQRLVMSLSR